MDRIEVDPKIEAKLKEFPHRLVFASLSGAHLYGFPSPDSDWDIRGTHVLPITEVVGLKEPDETYEFEEDIAGLEIDHVSYDVRKFFVLLLKKNGNVLEQLFSPLVLRTSSEHEELRDIAKKCITKHHAHHYRGMARNRRRAFGDSREVKPLLYAIRSYLTGIHLMRAGEVEPNLVTLNEEFGLAWLEPLLEIKQTGEHATLIDEDPDVYADRLDELELNLERAFEQSTLPENPAGEADLNELLVRLRLA